MNNITNLPLSSNQKRLWIVEQHDIENPAYNLSLTNHLKGAIDTGILTDNFFDIGGNSQDIAEAFV